MSIEVYCDDRSHGHWMRYVLARGDDGIWRPVDTRWLKAADNPLQRLSADEMPHVGGPDRYRYRFWCNKCGDTVPVRGEKLQAMFDKWAAAGESSISVAGIASTVR